MVRKPRFVLPSSRSPLSPPEGFGDAVGELVHLQVEQDKLCPVQKRPEPPPLTAAELDVVREAIKDRNGGADVWDVLAETRLPHRRAEELRQLYWQQGYKAGRRWRTGAESAPGTLPPFGERCPSTWFASRCQKVAHGWGVEVEAAKLTSTDGSPLVVPSGRCHAFNGWLAAKN